MFIDFLNIYARFLISINVRNGGMREAFWTFFSVLSIGLSFVLGAAIFDTPIPFTDGMLKINTFIADNYFVLFITFVLSVIFNVLNLISMMVIEKKNRDKGKSFFSEKNSKD